MTQSHTLFSTLFMAALATAAFAALAHVILVSIAARSIGLELIYIFGLSFVIAFPVTLIGGAVLLWLVKMLGLGLASSFWLFLISIQIVAIGLEMFFFEISFANLSWQYAWISVPAAIIAWYSSVYRALKDRQS